MADYIPEEILNDIMRQLTPVNRLAVELEKNHGMRISDVLSQRWSEGWQDVLEGKSFSVTYVEQKTKKIRQIWPLPHELKQLSRYRQKDSDFLFPGNGESGHRTRQAVWKDLHTVSRLFRVDGKRLVRSIGTHTARKVYAVRLYDAACREGSGDPLAIVQKDLNHADKSVAFIYAMADEIADKRFRGRL